ncbi:MAG: nucleoside monophosphate kinase [Verrucomicrobiae bacterium]|nr:nucleoside monophosphate kinase [Verrucomicrobiae bacterium]MCB1090899.1 nucleoside monophosphate kinase [Verrucomicrobiae bacterium]
MSKLRPARYRSFILTGAPGSGKGTQGAILGEIPRFYHFSMGDAFRSLDTRTEIGQEFVRYSSAGQLVPDELTIRFFRTQLDARADLHDFKPDIDILVLDGVPRNRSQAALLAEHLDVLHLFHLSCPDRDELITRLRKRALKSGRLDDASEEVIHHRIRTYEEETKELFDFYPDDIRTTVNADQPPVKVLADILNTVLANPAWQHATVPS